MRPATELHQLRHLILTGGTGYIGRYLTEAALDAGVNVTHLGRLASAQSGPRHLPWTLDDGLPADAVARDIPLDQQAIVHLAHDRRTPSSELDRNINIVGTRKLLESCRARGLRRFVFVSSQSARIGAPDVYGRIKWQIEQMLDEHREVSARVGLVYGGQPRGMYGLLLFLCRMAPALPMVEPWREVQPIHVREVARGLLLLSDGLNGGLSGLADPAGIRFGAFLQCLAADLYGKRLHIIPIPLRLALLACAATRIVPFIPAIEIERILGLAGTRPMATAADLRELDLTVAPLRENLRHEPAGKKTILAEGRSLLKYVLREEPECTLLRRYARAAATVDNGRPLQIPLCRRWPRLLRLREPLGKGSILARRLAIATGIAEVSPQGERVLAAGTRTQRLITSGFDLIVDCLLLPVRMIAQWPQK